MPSSLSARARHKDQILVWTLRACALVAGLILLLVVLFVCLEAWPALREVGLWRFFRDPGWQPQAVEGRYNLLPMLWGTLYATCGAVLLATPLGILSAVFCHFYAPAPLARGYRRLIGLLAGIPSVVYGFWGLVVLVPLIREWQPPGPSLLAGILVLTLMILPTLALMADAALAGVPRHYLDSAAALGLSRWGTACKVVLPAARPGLYTGVILQTGRAIGETMAILMVCGNIVQTPGSLFDPIRTLTANIALEMAYAAGDHRAALFVSGLLLLVMIVALAAAAELIGKGRVAHALR